MDDFAVWLEHQLTEAGGRLAPQSSKVRFRRARVSLGGAATLIAPMVAIAVAVFALMTLGGRHPIAARDPGAQRLGAARGARSVPTDLTRSFAAFRRPRTTSDNLPLAIALQEQANPVDPRLSRLVLATLTMRIWIVPGRQQTCLVVVGGGGSGPFGCSTNASAETSGLVRADVLRASAARGQKWFGVLPDGSSAVTATENGGRSISMSLNANGAFLQLVNLPTSLSYKTPDGVVVHLPLPAARLR